MMKLRYILITAAIVTGLVFLFAINGCQEAPVGSLDAAKQALKKAADAGARRYALSKYRYAESIMQVGWMEMARQNGRVSLLRDYDKADSLLLIAVQIANEAGKKATDSIETLQTRSSHERSDLAASLDEWQSTVSGSLVQKRAAKYLSSAKFALNTSRELEKAGEYEEAISELDKAEHALQRVGILVSNYSAEEADMIGTWRRWVLETVADSKRNGAYAIVVVKADRKTYLLKNGSVIHTYDCDLGFNSSQQKMLSGDGATPEGKYRVTKYRPTGSLYYKALLLNYPNEQDSQRFKSNKEKGVISRNAHIGGLIEIHGEGGRNEDWTDGCVALSNGDMDHLMRYANSGTPVTIVRKSDQWP